MSVSVRRIALLAVTGVSLYLVAPALLDTFSSWQRLSDIWPGALALIVALEFAGLACICVVQRLALHRPRWLPVVTSQLPATPRPRSSPEAGRSGRASVRDMSVMGRNSIANMVSVTPGGVGVNQAANVAALGGETDAATATAYSLGQQLAVTA